MKTGILRRWQDRIATVDRERYTRYFTESGASAYRDARGCTGFQLLFRDREDETSAVETLSWWVSEGDIAAFTGPDALRARYFERDAEFLLDRPERVEHFEVASSTLVVPKAWNNVTLLGQPGTGSDIVQIMLNVCEVPTVFEDMTGYTEDGLTRSRIIAVNPLGQVPVLLLGDGTVMTETAAIALRLDELFPAARLAPPNGSDERDRFLRLLIWIVANIYPTFTYGDEPTRWTADAAGLRTATDSYRQTLWRWLENETQGPFVLGKHSSALDVFVLVMRKWRPRNDWFDNYCPKLSHAADQYELSVASASIRKELGK